MNSTSENRPARVLAQLPRFLLAGGTAALMNFGSRLLFSLCMGFEYAVVCAFFVGLTSGFVLSKRFVFDNSTRRLHHEIVFFVAVNLLALLQTWLLSVYLAGLLSPVLGAARGEALAHLAGIMLPVISSYFGHKYFTFRA
jgi:putative flippase GtrA